MLLDKKMLVFLAVAEGGGYSDASRKLRLGQSVLSHHVDALEQELGVKLFYKKGRHIALTEEGEVLFREGKKLFKAAQKMEEVFSDQSSKVARRINLAGDAITCSFTLPWMLADFRKQHPDVSFTYKHLQPHEIIDNLLDEEVDMALTGHLVSHRKLVSEPCFRDTILLVGPLDFPGSITLPDLSALSLLWYTHDLGLQQLLHKKLSCAGMPVKNLHVFMEVEDLPTLKTFIRAGVGCAFLPRLSVEEELRLQQLKIIQVDQLVLERTNYRLYRKRPPQKEIVTSFLDFVRRETWGPFPGND